MCTCARARLCARACVRACVHAPDLLRYATGARQAPHFEWARARWWVAGHGCRQCCGHASAESVACARAHASASARAHVRAHAYADACGLVSKPAPPVQRLRNSMIARPKPPGPRIQRALAVWAVVLSSAAARAASNTYALAAWALVVGTAAD